jgi:translocation and assembly module TamB
VTVDPSRLASGRLTLHGRDLDDLSPLLLEKVAGTIDADLTFTRDSARQAIAVEAKGLRLAGFGMGLEKLSADLTATDLYQRPTVTGSAELSDARIGSKTIKRLRLDSKGTAEASDVTLTASAQGVDVEANGRVISATSVRLDLANLDARRGSTRIGLAEPATITHEDKQTAIRNLTFLMNGGRLSVDGRVGQSSDLKVRAIGVPLSVAAFVAPDLGLSGTLDGEGASPKKRGSKTNSTQI